MASKKSTSKSIGRGHKLEGCKAPTFELPDSGGATVKLENLLGRGALVLYFYPKDMTPGCTRQACGFRDRLDEIRSAGAQVVGISGDPAGSHQKFAERNALNFTLLSDADHRVARLYGVYKKKSLYGREFMGIERTTFLIDKAGVIRKVYPRVSVDGHAEKVLEDLRQMG
jgi:thioredoxin-dependent peroxiredoxin